MEPHEPLTTAIDSVRKRILQFGQPGSAVNEANTKNWFIEPLLRAMGWDTHDPTAVQAEYRAQGAGQNPVDYALMVDGAPALFLEAKALGTPLQTPQFVNQVVAYGAVAGVQWVVITDGDWYRIYRTDTTAAAPEKLLAAFQLSDVAHGAEALDFLMTLRRDALALDKPHGLWTERDVDRQVKAELLTALSGADHAFVKFLARRLPGLRASDVAASLRRAAITIAFPKAATVMAGVGGKPVVGPVAAPAAAPHQTASPRAVGDKGERIARLVAALDREGARWPVPVYGTYKGQRFMGSMQRDGSVTVLGRAFGTFSAAAHSAMVSVSGTPASVTVNGWRFWRVHKQDGSTPFVDDLAPKFP